VLGSGTAVPTAARDNTALAFRLDGAAVLIDCPGSVEQKLARAGMDPARLDAVVITHAHIDHAYGLPSLLQNLHLLGRSAPLPIFVQPADHEWLQRLLAVWKLQEEVAFLDLQPLVPHSAIPFWERGGHRLFALATDHSRPACAIRWDLPTAPGAPGRRVVYSSDTRPVEALAEFSRGATYLIHEATFAEADAARAQQTGHSTPRQAGRIAALADAQRLLLVHLDIGADAAQWVTEARASFAGPIEVPVDGSVYVVG
jgi:ribonuclease Z